MRKNSCILLAGVFIWVESVAGSPTPQQQIPPVIIQYHAPTPPPPPLGPPIGPHYTRDLFPPPGPPTSPSSPLIPRLYNSLRQGVLDGYGGEGSLLSLKRDAVLSRVRLHRALVRYGLGVHEHAGIGLTPLPGDASLLERWIRSHLSLYLQLLRHKLSVSRHLLKAKVDMGVNTVRSSTKLGKDLLISAIFPRWAQIQINFLQTLWTIIRRNIRTAWNLNYDLYTDNRSLWNALFNNDKKRNKALTPNSAPDQHGLGPLSPVHDDVPPPNHIHYHIQHPGPPQAPQWSHVDYYPGEDYPVARDDYSNPQHTDDSHHQQFYGDQSREIQNYQNYPDHSKGLLHSTNSETMAQGRFHRWCIPTRQGGLFRPLITASHCYWRQT